MCVAHSFLQATAQGKWLKQTRNTLEIRGCDPAGAVLYAAKCYWPDVTEDEVKGLVDRMSRGPREVRYLGSLLFEGDDLVLCMFDAASATDARGASERAGLPCERVMEAAWLAHDTTKGARR
jgi:hypothetical protein